MYQDRNVFGIVCVCYGYQCCPLFYDFFRCVPLVEEELRILPEFSTGLQWGSCCSIVSFLCSVLHHCLFLAIFSLFICDLRLLITLKLIFKHISSTHRTKLDTVVQHQHYRKNTTRLANSNTHHKNHYPLEQTWRNIYHLMFKYCYQSYHGFWEIHWVSRRRQTRVCNNLMNLAFERHRHGYRESLWQLCVHHIDHDGDHCIIFRVRGVFDTTLYDKVCQWLV